MNKVIEGNKIIAEFMGGKLKVYNISNAEYYIMSNKQKWMPEELKYHTSWDWLMPVYVKMQNIGADKGLSYEKFYTNFHVGVTIGDIRYSWLAVVDFINWYNQQK